MIKGKLVLFLIILTIAVLLPFCSGTDDQAPASEKKNIIDYFKKYITVAELENAGFEHINSSDFTLLVIGKHLYILNRRDFLFAKFSGNKLLRVFKTQKGQAPKEMITPMSVFLYENDTIAVFDYSRSGIIFFDVDLNFLKEIKLKKEFKRMARVGKRTVALLNDQQENVFGVLDRDFNIARAVVKANNKIPAERYYRWNLNEGFFLDDKLVSHSYSLFPHKQCKVDIYNVYTEELVATLPWEQPFSPTAKSINERRNLYYLHHVGKYGAYYVVYTSHSKTLIGNVRYYEFMIFDRNGTLKYKGGFPYGIMKVAKDTNNAKLYFMDDDEGISYIDIEEFIR